MDSNAIMLKVKLDDYSRQVTSSKCPVTFDASNHRTTVSGLPLLRNPNLSTN